MNNHENQNFTIPPPANSAKSSHTGVGVAVTSLTLGVISLFFSLFVFGVIFGLLGLIFGIVHLARKMPLYKSMAVWGLILSILGITAGVFFGAYYVIRVHQTLTAMKELEAQKGITGVQPEGYIGSAAPDINLVDLEGNEIAVSNLKGKRVILNFWATWCPPCTKETPHFITLADEIKSENLVIIGISSENKVVLKKYIEKNGINYPIASAEKLPLPYAAISSIPTTFFIDRKGIIQNVLVGYHDYETLKENATAEDYQGQEKTAPAEPQKELKEPKIKRVFKAQWNLNIPGAAAICAGNWNSNSNQNILAIDSNKMLHVIDIEGRIAKNIAMPAAFKRIEIGKNKQKGCMLLGYSNWSDKVTVVDCNGVILWEFKAKDGVNGAHWGDLNGDNNDEMIVGMNGSGGLCALSCDGKQMWKVSDIGNVWNQAVVAASNPQNRLVFATEAGGSIKIYDSSGKLIRSLRPMGKYFAQMTAAVLDCNDKIQVTAIGADGDIIALDPQGRVIWQTTTLKKRSWRTTNFACGDIDGDGCKEWAFIGSNGDLIIANCHGTKVASLPAQNEIENFLIYSSPAGAGLVTMAKGNITSYSLIKADNDKL